MYWLPVIRQQPICCPKTAPAVPFCRNNQPRGYTSAICGSSAKIRRPCAADLQIGARTLLDQPGLWRRRNRSCSVLTPPGGSLCSTKGFRHQRRPQGPCQHQETMNHVPSLLGSQHRLPSRRRASGLNRSVCLSKTGRARQVHPHHGCSSIYGFEPAGAYDGPALRSGCAV